MLLERVSCEDHKNKIHWMGIKGWKVKALEITPQVNCKNTSLFFYHYIKRTNTKGADNDINGKINFNLYQKNQLPKLNYCE